MSKNLAASILNNIYSNKFIKIFVWLFLIIMTFFTVKKYLDFSIFESIGFIISDYNFLFLCFFPFSLLIMKSMYDSYENNYYIKSRFKNNSKFTNEIVKGVVISETIYFIIIVMIITIMLNLFSNGNYDVFYLKSFQMTNIIFCIYSIMKVYLFTIIISLLNIQLMKHINSILIMIGNVLLYFVFLLNVYLNINVISHPLSFSISNSLTTTKEYSNYYFDFSNYSFHIIMIVLFLLFICRKKVKEH